jgi:phosphoglycerate dehydrogenase-like enzyme
MQILMSEAARARIAGRLHTLPAGLDILTINAEGLINRGTETLPEDAVDPDIFWFSLDLYKSPSLAPFFGAAMRGTKGQWLQSCAAGVDNPAFRHIMAKNIRLTKSSAQASAIAEYVLSHAFSLLHPITQQAEAQSTHAWRTINFREIAATRWLILGYGAIGTEIGRRLHPFGAHLTIVRRTPQPDPLANEVHPTADLLNLLPQTDVVILACALNEQTRHIANAEFFTALKPGSLLINIARGALLDEQALHAGLARNQPAHAVLDVTDPEPPAPDSWLWDHPQIRLTAHCSNAGDGVLARGDTLFLENLRRFLNGETLLHEAAWSEVGL